MAVAQGTCPSCGAPIEFSVGASIAKVCPFCNATVVRSDRGLENLGKVAAIANTPSLIAIGDIGTLGGRAFEVLGRVQLDHGQGPWDEYYVSFDHGAAWGWLAYAQGQWIVSSEAPGVPIPARASLELEQDVALGAERYRVAEIKTGTITSAEGELPEAFPPGFRRQYADLFAPQNGFATLDYGDGSAAPTAFIGRVFSEPDMVVTQLGERSSQKVQTKDIRCPACGGDIPKLAGERSQRIGCPYCGAVSDIALQQVVAQQERAMRAPEIPVGSRGNIEGVEWVCIAYMRRSTEFDGERFTWEEYLLFSQPIGFRWLVKDEGQWSWVTPVNGSELDLSAMPGRVRWGGKAFSVRNQNSARVDYVLGEVYWKCEVGETTGVMDFIHGRDVLSREAGPGEVRWSHSAPVPWALLKNAFGIHTGRTLPPPPPRSGLRIATLLGTLTLGVLLSCSLVTCGGCNTDRPYVGNSYGEVARSYPRSYSGVFPSRSTGSSSSSGSSSYRGGSSSYSGGK
ncbi:MAG: DUF4178 domain-containing protein [Polyangiaceae bacterium]|nr:DUF4178 domain-containing protein [Polyangiaceae bacterium]